MIPYSLLFLLVSFASLALSVKIGITPDYYDYETVTEGSISFSAQIDFEDKTIPGDKSKMSDGQLINLAKVAYDEMVELWAHYLQDEKLCPATMMAMVSEGSIYFTSSIKSSDSDSILREYADVNGSPAKYIKNLMNGFGSHRYGGCCAEPNGLYFYSEQNRKGDEPFKTPPKNDQGPRVAVWLRPYGESPGSGKERAENPCWTTQDGYGCETLVDEYGFKLVDKKAAVDPTGQDDWKFTTAGNRRNPAQCPNQPPEKPPPSRLFARARL